MSTATSVGPCSAPRMREWSGGLLPADPFTSVRYHYGMLLGEEDFVTDQAYHRGKVRLHNAAFHGAGVRWGFDVEVERDEGGPTGDIRVHPGLALDPLGHELHIERAWCADLAVWFAEHQDEEGFDVVEDGDDRVFDAHVVVCFRACVSRPVPALVEPCEGEASDVECSRTQETVRLELRPGAAPAPASRAGHLMRIFVGLDVVRDDYRRPRQETAAEWARDRREELAGITDTDARRSFLREVCGRLAALDTVLWRWGGEDGFPEAEDPCVVLAELPGVRVSPAEEGEGWTLTHAEPDVSVRPTLLSTDAIQELLCAAPALVASGAVGGGDPGDGTPSPEPEDPSVDAGGPRIHRDGVVLDGSDVVLPFQGDPLQRSLTEPGAVEVESFQSSSGWDSLQITDLQVSRSGGDAEVRVVLTGPPPEGALRVLVRGTGPRPVMSRRGDRFVPLAGAVGDPPDGPHTGADFVHMITV